MDSEDVDFENRLKRTAVKFVIAGILILGLGIYSAVSSDGGLSIESIAVLGLGVFSVVAGVGLRVWIRQTERFGKNKRNGDQSENSE